MAGLKHNVIRSGLEALYFSGAHMLMRPFVGGIGMILMLHHVRPPRPDRFQPNRLLEVTPYFLEKLCRKLRRSRLDIVTLDQFGRHRGHSGRLSAHAPTAEDLVASVFKA